MPTRLWNRWLAGLAALAVLACAPEAARGQRRNTKEAFRSRLSAALDRVQERIGKPRGPLAFGVNLFFAHEVMIERVPLETLTRAVDALRAAGVRRIDINMGLFPWRDGNRDAVAKYDRLIEHIRTAGLQLAINPQYSPAYHHVSNFAEWRRAALDVYRQIAERYEPDVFVVVHEPTTMSTRMGGRASVSEWRDFAEASARLVKKVSPRTRAGAGGLAHEEEYFNSFLGIGELDVFTVDIYGLLGLPAYNRMIEGALGAGKPVYIEETWRPPYISRLGGSLEQMAMQGVCDGDLQDLDRKWLRTFAAYGASWGLEAITAFWMPCFFEYGTEDDDALDEAYVRRVISAINDGKRTETYSTLRDLIREFGR